MATATHDFSQHGARERERLPARDTDTGAAVTESTLRMLTALFADIHGNAAALEACLCHARERGAARHAFLGDFVGYGPDPDAVVQRIAGIDDAIVLKGNHDEAIEVEPRTRDLNDVAYAVISWTRSTLSAEQRRYLAALPLIVRRDQTCFVHASAQRPEKWDYIYDATAAQKSMEAAATPYTFCGHVHDQMLYFKTPSGRTAAFRPTPGSPVPMPHHRRWLAIVGSVGQPRDGNPAAAYALFDDTAEAMTFFRVPYEHEATAARMYARGMPMAALLAERLARGS
jgi:diadenosine tetraphosphatase ApaH/serine/threonine PP2A family protein phosphatase